MGAINLGLATKGKLTWRKKAAALPAQLTVPMIVFFLPVLFVVILGPVVLRISAMQKHDSSTPVINSHPTPKNPH